MSRTMKDIPYHVLEERAINDGFLLPIINGPLIHRTNPVTHFTVAVPETDHALADDWMTWMRSLGFSVRIQGSASSGDVVTLSDRYEYCPGIGYMRDFPLGDRVVFDPISHRFLDSIDYDIRPERNALNPDMSIRDTDVTIISGVIPIATRLSYVNSDYPEDGDVNGWISHKSRHDHHYRNCNRRHDRYVVVRERRNKVRESLRRARECATDGRMDDGFDDPILYGSRPRMEWV